MQLKRRSLSASRAGANVVAALAAAERLAESAPSFAEALAAYHARHAGEIDPRPPEISQQPVPGTTASSAC